MLIAVYASSSYLIVILKCWNVHWNVNVNLFSLLELNFFANGISACHSSGHIARFCSSNKHCTYMNGDLSLCKERSK